MNRTTRKDVEGQFNRLLYLFNKRQARSYDDVGAWRLDYNSCYGGYVIEEIVTTSGGITHPFKCYRRSAAEFVAWSFDITRAIEVYVDAASIGYDKVYKLRGSRQRNKDNRLLPPARVE